MMYCMENLGNKYKDENNEKLFYDKYLKKYLVNDIDATIEADVNDQEELQNYFGLYKFADKVDEKDISFVNAMAFFISNGVIFVKDRCVIHINLDNLRAFDINENINCKGNSLKKTKK